MIWSRRAAVLAIALGGMASCARGEDVPMLERVISLAESYLAGFQAESTGLCYHHRLNGPAGLDALASPEEIAARRVGDREMPWGYGSGIQDVALENGQLLFALCDAYEATGDRRLGTIAQGIWSGVKRIGSVSPYAGFVPRGPHPDGVSYYPNSSRDQHAVYGYALWRWYHSPLASDDDRAFIAQFLDAFAERMERNGWRVMVEDESEVAHVGFAWTQRALPGAISLLGTLRVVADVTGDARWLELWERYSAEDDGFRWELLAPERAPQAQPFTLYWNQFGLDFISLARILGDDPRGAQVRACLTRWRGRPSTAMSSTRTTGDDWTGPMPGTMSRPRRPWSPSDCHLTSR